MLTGDGQLRAAQDALRKLDAERKSIEVEAAAIVDELMAPGEGGAEPIGIDTPLVDREGYPRADIDVYRARMQRKSTLACHLLHRVRKIIDGEADKVP